MWIYSAIGFHSAVATDDQDVLMVRGRVRQDLVRLQGLLAALGHEPPEILEWELRDYPYRVLIPRSAWAEVLRALAAAVDYTNWKQAVAEIQGAERATCYDQLWLITRTLMDIDDGE